jgi:hypothetical protein
LLPQKGSDKLITRIFGKNSAFGCHFDLPGLFIDIVDAASCRILGKSGKMPLLQQDAASTNRSYE